MEPDYLLRGLGIQGPGGLIGQDDLGPRDKRPGYGDPLILSTRELGGGVLRPVPEAHSFKVIQGDPVALLSPHLPVIKGQGHVFLCVLECQEIEGLEDEAQVAVSEKSRPCRRQVLDERALQAVLPAVVVVQDSNDVQQGGLPGARGAHYRDELPGFNAKVEPPEHLQPTRVHGVGFADPFEGEHETSRKCRIMPRKVFSDQRMKDEDNPRRGSPTGWYRKAIP